MASVILAESASINGAAAPPSPAGAPNKAFEKAFLEFHNVQGKLPRGISPLEHHSVIDWLNANLWLNNINVNAAVILAQAKYAAAVSEWKAARAKYDAAVSEDKAAKYEAMRTAERDQLNAVGNWQKSYQLTAMAISTARVVCAFYALSLPDRETKIQKAAEAKLAAKDYKASVFVSANSCMCGGRCHKHSSLLKQFE
jgi:hypothetical protein